MTKANDGRYPYCKTCCKKKQRTMYLARGRASWLGEKTCTWCQQLKSVSDYGTDGAGKRRTRCRSCEADIALHEGRGERRCNICRQWLPTDRFYPSKLKFPNVACQECTRAQVAQPRYRLRRRDYTLQKEYGITLERYKELLAKQGHRCPICLKEFELNNFSYPLDHAHGGKFKGRIRAIAHQDCNRFVMWMHEDSAQLRRAADLIDNPLTDWVVPGVTANERKRMKEK